MSTFTLEFLEQIYNVTAWHEVQAEAQDAQVNTHGSISIYACRVKDFVNKRWTEYDAKIPNRKHVSFFIQGLPVKLKRLANEKKMNHNPTLDEIVIFLNFSKNISIENTMVME